MPKHFLSVVAIFKNESHILKEWLDHYISEGVDHFYLIENNSTDNWKEVLQPYLDKGLVTLFDDKRNHPQIEVYNELVLPLKNESEWLAIVDLDEFAYAKKGSLADFLRARGDHICGVQMPWIIFGSSGRKEQPSSVIDGFMMRKIYPYNGPIIWVKTIVRTRALRRISVHTHDLTEGIVINGYGGVEHRSDMMRTSEDYIHDASVLLNHYVVQSRDWFFTVKTERSKDCAEKWGPLKPGKEYFEYYDQNDKVDNTLAAKRWINKICPNIF